MGMVRRLRSIVSRGMTLWLILLGALLAYAIPRLARERARRPVRPLSFGPSRELLGLVTVADVAFDYERAVLELDDISDETRERALWALSRIIVPLLGRVRLDDVTPQLEEGVGTVLRAQLDVDDYWVIHVCNDVLRWGRQNVAASTQRTRQRRLGPR